MAKRQYTEFAVPDVQEPVRIESSIEDLRRSIMSNCIKLFKRAREINAVTPRNSAFRLRYWETQVSQLKEAQMATFSIEKLRQLNSRCKTLLRQIEQFRK